MGFEGLADAIFQGGVYEQTHRHHHQQRPDTFGLFAVERGGEQLRVLQKAAPAFRMLLTFVPVQHLVRCTLGIVEFIGGQDATPVLVDAALARRERGGQGPVNLGEDVVGWRVSSGAPPFAIAGLSAHRTAGQNSGLRPLRTARQRLLRIGFAGKGSPTQVLPRFAIVSTVLQELLLDRAPGCG